MVTAIEIEIDQGRTFTGNYRRDRSSSNDGLDQGPELVHTGIG